MSHLSEEEQTARKDILDHFGHIKARGFKPKDALDQLVREIAFTHLNRLCAYKMMEAREVYVGGQKFREAVSRGINSNGVKFYLADHPEEERLFNTGHQDIAYRHFLDWLGGLLSNEIGVLFSPNDPANRLYPRQKVLDDVLDLLNGGGIKPDETELRAEWPKIWSQDETIGWVYQYFTPKELRDQARKESQAPRNSYELAFRNQFFTPRYVVEFLTDNTLGRIWFEMRKGNTTLKEQCRYMVRRPTELFLKKDEEPPKNDAEKRNDLSQEELLKQPVCIPHRAKKDPRELKVLDPACGSGHFLLYCFDLFLAIYEEAYTDTDLGPALKQDYETPEDLRRDVPRLILAHNLHGIDIDLRASQIAALALWLRCQRAYQEMGLKKDRPTITRSNFVCAEPMPGEEQMRKEFVSQLEPKFLGQVVEVVFDKMKLAGETGSLLKIETEIRETVAEARKQWTIGPVAIQRSLFGDETPAVQQQRFDFSGITDNQFFEQAEAKVIETLSRYAEKAQNGQKLQRRLFAGDAVRGFAFVDVCHKRYDVLLMNPPFGLGLKTHYPLMKLNYPDGYVDVYSCFLSRSSELCTGRIGFISSRSFLLTKKLARLRRGLILPHIALLLDLGWSVMDAATVQSCACILDMKAPLDRFIALDRKELSDKSQVIKLEGGNESSYFVVRSKMLNLPESRVLYSLPDSIVSLLKADEKMGSRTFIAKQGMKTFNDFRFLRLRQEVSPDRIGQSGEWEPLSKGGPYAIFYADLPLLVYWNKSGNELAEENKRVNGQTAQARQASVYYRLPGATYSRRSSKDFGVRALPAGCIVGEKGPAILSEPPYSNEYVIGLLNSRLMNSLVHLQANAKQYDTGILEGLPWKQPSKKMQDSIESISRACIDSVRTLASTDETDSLFHSVPFGNSISEMATRWRAAQHAAQLLLNQSLPKISETVDAIYGVDSRPLQALLSPTADDSDEDANEDDGVDEPECEESSFLGAVIAPQDTCKALLSLCVGCGLGRWNVSSVFQNEHSGRPTSAFAAIPQCSPAMLQGADGLPYYDPPHSYPLSIDSDGILTDDSDNPKDIVQRVRQVLEVVWKNRCDAIEKEACETLQAKELREYFRKPGKGGFWDDHITRYSKSRRKAPIYWLLQSSKKNYALWLYYHRLDKDLLFKALINFVEPKIRLETGHLETLRNQMATKDASGKEAKRLSKEFEQQEDFLSELRDFEEKLRRAANLHLEPNLNDGVVLNIASLYELVPWKEAKNYWEELLDGKYEWSSIGRQLRQKGLVK
jgi:hypothetical protein